MAENIKSIVGNSIGTINGNMIVGDNNNNIYQIDKIENISNIDGNGNITLQAITNSNVKIEITVSEKLFYEQRELIIKTLTNTETIIQAQNILLGFAEKIKADTSEIKDLVKEILKKLNTNAPIPKILTTPPFTPPVFEGRDEELKAVHDKLFGGQNFIMLVNGQGGIGKTSFAGKYWERYQSEYFHLAFLYVESGIADALLTLQKPLNLEFQPETKTPERLNQILLRAANLQKPCLLILDNANNEDDLKENIGFLNQCKNFHIMLTSRLADFKHSQKHPLGTLDKKYALKVFKYYYQAFDDSEALHFDTFFDAIGGNTLVLELFAKNLDYFNTEWDKPYTLQNLITEVQKGLTKLSQSATVETYYQAKGTGLRNETPQAIILAMYDLNDLPETEQELLSVFAVLPAENIPVTNLKLLISEQNYTKDTRQLVRKGWIEFNPTEQSFKISPVVQEIVRFKNSHRLATDTEILIDNLNEQLRYEGISLSYHTIESALPYVRYAESVFAALRRQATYSLSILPERIATYYQAAGNFDKALQFFNLLTDLFKELYEANPKNENFKNGLAISYSKLGDIYQKLGDFDKALQFFNLQTDLFKELYEANPKSENLKNGLAISYEKLGGIYLSINKKQEAKSNYEMCKLIFESLVKENSQNITNQTNYAEITAITGIFTLHQNPNNEQAKQEIQQAIKIWQFLYDQTKSIYYKKKIDLVMQYMNNTSDYKTTIINLTKE